MRKIKRVSHALRVRMDDNFIDQPLPNGEMDQLDPFLLIHHWNKRYEGGQRQRELGVGPHPHRGFYPVTFVYKGGVHHRDSRGNDSVVNEGGTQWMNSGMGIVHSERPRKDIAEDGGDFELIQFWVNNPSAYKMSQPEYIPLRAEDTPVFTSDGGKVKVQVISGEFEGVRGAIHGNSPLLILRINLQEGGKTHIDVPSDYNALIYQLDGNLKINEQSTRRKSMIVFEQGEGDISIEATEASRAILLAGLPIGEPVETYGSFVMNDQTQILEALRDYQMGKMGVLIEDFDSE